MKGESNVLICTLLSRPTHYQSVPIKSSREVVVTRCRFREGDDPDGRLTDFLFYFD